MMAAVCMGLLTTIGIIPARALNATPIESQQKDQMPIDELWQLYSDFLKNKNHQDTLEILGQQLGLLRPDNEAITIHAIRAAVHADDDNLNGFLQSIGSAISIDAGQGHYWNARLFDQSPDKAFSLKSVHYLIEENSPLLQQFDTPFFWRVVNDLRDQEEEDAGAEEQVYDLLSKLEAGGYSGGSEGNSPEYLYLELTRLQLKRGLGELAALTAKKHLKSPQIMIDIWHDKIYEPLWASLAEAGFFRHSYIVEQEIKIAKDGIAKSQNTDWEGWLKNRLNMVQALRQVGQIEKAKQYAEITIEVTPADYHTLDNFFWIQNERAYLLEDLGDRTSALAIMEKVSEADPDEHGGIISQIINYSIMLWRAGQPEKSVEIADKIIDELDDYTSDYGTLWAKAAKICALTDMDQSELAQKIYDEAKSEPDTNYSAVTASAVCMQDLEYAKELYKERLADDEARATALIALSTFRRSGNEGRGAIIRDAITEIAKAPDVIEVVDKVGRLGNWQLPLSYWGTY
jgi:tetratricopeptide (TPR) repeat protein